MPQFPYYIVKADTHYVEQSRSNNPIMWTFVEDIERAQVFNNIHDALFVCECLLESLGIDATLIGSNHA